MHKRYSTFVSPCWALLLFLLSCTTAKETNVIDRTAIPEVINGVPGEVSEIREVKFNSASSESGHEVLHLQGMLFTKSSTGVKTQITPCGGCVVRISTPEDTTISASLTTHKDGYFEYNGKLLSYTFTLDNPGMNPVIIESVPFQKEGFMTLKIVQAAGSTPERFRIKKDGNAYTWAKVQ